MAAEGEEREMTREEAIKIMTWRLSLLRDYCAGSREVEAVEMAIEALKQPEQKQGKWIVTGTFFDFLKCSCCGYKKPWNQDIFNFCPNCGARMEEE